MNRATRRSGRLDPLFERFKEAEALAARSGETGRLDAIYSFLVQYHWAKGEQEQALEYGRRCIDTGQTRNDLGLQVTGLFYLAHACEALGRFPRVLEHAQGIIGLLAGARETERFGLSGLPYCGACALAADSLIELGDFHGALEWIERGERVAEAAGHLYSRTPLAIARGRLLLERDQVADAIAGLEPAVATCREKNFVGQLMRALTPLGHAYAREGRATEGIPLLKEAISLQEKASAFVHRGHWIHTLAVIYLHDGRLEEAQATALDALGFAERHGERAVEGRIRYTLGEIALRRGERATAEQFFDEAQEIAEELGMRPLLEQCRARLLALR